MDIVEFGSFLSRLLPKIKTTLQISGLALGAALTLFVHFAKPGDNLALIIVGSVGVSVIIFAQLFHFLQDFRQRDRPIVFLGSFLTFCTFFVLLLVIITIRLSGQPSLLIGPHKPTSASWASKINPLTEVRAEEVKTNWINLSLNDVIRLSPADYAGKLREVDYKFQVNDGISTLTARLKYLDLSRAAKYPSSDFYYDGPSFGYPWLSFNIANPTNDIILYSQLKTELMDVRFINDVIISAPMISDVGNSAELKLSNRGWGQAFNSVLLITLVQSIGGDKYRVALQDTFDVGHLDSEKVVDIFRMLPPPSKWESFIILGKLTYKSEIGESKVETFRTKLYRKPCCGGGAILWSSQYNLMLPSNKEDYPFYTAISSCVGARSADKFVVRFSSERSARFKLKLTLTPSSGSPFERVVVVESVVPRDGDRYAHHLGKESFFERADKMGCN